MCAILLYIYFVLYFSVVEILPLCFIYFVVVFFLSEYECFEAGWFNFALLSLRVLRVEQKKLVGIASLVVLFVVNKFSV